MFPWIIGSSPQPMMPCRTHLYDQLIVYLLQLIMFQHNTVPHSTRRTEPGVFEAFPRNSTILSGMWKCPVLGRMLANVWLYDFPLAINQITRCSHCFTAHSFCLCCSMKTWAELSAARFCHQGRWHRPGSAAATGWRHRRQCLYCGDTSDTNTRRTVWQ